MRLFISAAEASSDTHGAELLKAIQNQWADLGDPLDDPIEAFGIGGPRLGETEFRSLVDSRELLSMGLGEVLGRLPRILRALRTVEQGIRRELPDVIVCIDYPDFHFRLVKRIRDLDIPIVYYIPPKIWVWRVGRAKVLKKYFSKILSILPFEEDFYRSFQIPCTYVGNPLLDELPLGLSRTQARGMLRLQADDAVVVLMPGSRPGELKNHFSILVDAVLKSSEWIQKQLKVLIPLSESFDGKVFQELQIFLNQKQNRKVQFTLVKAKAAECLVAADGAIIKSGTSTLEAALLNCPHLVVYRPNQLTAWVFRFLVRYRGPVSLVNLLASWSPGKPFRPRTDGGETTEFLVPELLCDEVTSEKVSQLLVRLLTQVEVREKMLKGFKEIQDKIGKIKNPSQTAAREVIQVIKQWSEKRKV